MNNRLDWKTNRSPAVWPILLAFILSALACVKEKETVIREKAVPGPGSSSAKQEMVGGIDSGGGYAVVCRDGSGQIQSAELYDFYEAERLYGLKIKRPQENGVSNEELRRRYFRQVISKTHSVFPSFSLGAKEKEPTDEEIDEIYDKIKVNFVELEKGTKIKPVNDVAPVVIPENCQLEQAAVFLKQNGVFLDKAIFAALSAFDQAGLIIHEVTYAMLRLFGAKNSFYARKFVAYTFAKAFGHDSATSIESVKNGMPEEYIECNGPAEGLTKASYEGFTKAFVFPVEDNVYRIQFAYLNGLPVISKKYADFSIVWMPIHRQGQVTNDHRISDHPMFSDNIETQSAVDGGDDLQLSLWPKADMSGVYRYELRIEGRLAWKDGQKMSVPLSCYNNHNPTVSWGLDSTSDLSDDFYQKINDSWVKLLEKANKEEFCGEESVQAWLDNETIQRGVHLAIERLLFWKQQFDFHQIYLPASWSTGPSEDSINFLQARNATRASWQSKGAYPAEPETSKLETIGANIVLDDRGPVVLKLRPFKMGYELYVQVVGNQDQNSSASALESSAGGGARPSQVRFKALQFMHDGGVQLHYLKKGESDVFTEKMAIDSIDKAVGSNCYQIEEGPE